MSTTQHRSLLDVMIGGLFLLVLRLLGLGFVTVAWAALVLFVVAFAPQWGTALALALVLGFGLYAWKRWPWLGSALPLVGDFARFASRRARREGNRLIRDLGWVSRSDDANYGVSLKRIKGGYLFTINAALAALTDPAKVTATISENLAVVPAADFELTHLGTGTYYVEFWDEKRPDPLDGVRHSKPDAFTTEVRVGRSTDGDVSWDPANAWHTAIQGATRSGKSALMYTLLSGLAGKEDARVVGVDPSGVLLGPWKAKGEPWIACGTADMTQAAEALENIVAEMDQRISRLIENGIDKMDPSPQMPALVVVLEEYPGTLSAARTEDDREGRKTGQRVAPRIEAAVGRLVKEGAKVGVRVLVLAQRMSAKAIDTDDRSNFGNRVTLRVDNADAVGMLHENAHELAPEVQLFGPGRALWEEPGRPLQRVQMDLTDYATYCTRIENWHAAKVSDFTPDA